MLVLEDSDYNRTMGRKWTEEQKQQMRDAQRRRYKREKELANRLPVIIPPRNFVEVNCSANFTIAELEAMPPENTKAIFNGIAAVLAANNQGESGSGPKST